MAKQKREYIIAKALAEYLRLQYPKAVFHYDLTGVNLSVAQAGMMKAIQGGRSYPDLFIAEPRKIDGHQFHGLYMELKAEGTRLTKRDGSWYNDHIRAQAEMLERLRERGYFADFAIGLDYAIKIADMYLTGAFK